MENNFFRRIPTDLDLNGPTLAYTTQPSDTIVDPTDTATFTVAAEATFPGNTGASDSGTITFQWYETTGGGKTTLTNDSKFSGTTSATLSISDCETPSDTRRFFICEISYTPGDEYDSADKGTAAALNEPLASNEVMLQVNPLLEIVTQPSNAVSGKNQTGTFTIGARLTSPAPYPKDATPAAEVLIYDWYVGVENATPTKVENKTYTTQNIEQITVIEDDESFVTDRYPVSQTGYSDFSVNAPPTTTSFSFTIAGARGGSGGSDANGSGGAGGGGRAGTFSIPNSRARGQSFTFRTGRQGGGGGRGNFPAFGPAGGSNIAPGGRGGGAGPRGWSGGGGGGGGASGVVRGDGALLASAGGGGGGGGGSLRRNASSGNPANTWFPYNGATINTYSGGQGQDQGSDGGGGGGGGGGSGGSAPGGSAGRDERSGGSGGGGGNSDYRSDIINLSNQWVHFGSGYASVNYTYTETRPVITPTPVIRDIVKTQNAVISGQGTPTLSITIDNSEFNAIRSIYCVVSASSAGNSPLTSDTVNHVVVDATQLNNVIIETISSDKTSVEQEVNLSNGEVEIVAGAQDSRLSGTSYLYSIYSPDKDINIEMDLFGGRGKTGTNGNLGGEGGYSRIRFTLEQNVEYIIGGMTQLINTPFVYRKAQLIAVVGAGGDASSGRSGGDGGGVNVAARRNNRNTHADGGVTIGAGTLPADGVWSRIYQPSTGVYPEDQVVPTNSVLGGRTLPCTKGVYYRQQGLAACQDITGTQQFLDANGSTVAETDSINRGYKDGYAIQTNGGLGRQSASPNALLGTANGFGNGGSGAFGGSGGLGNQGGGGGSGYTDGSVTVVDTQLGGSTKTFATVILRLAA